jgi:hypothetical protein
MLTHLSSRKASFLVGFAFALKASALRYEQAPNNSLVPDELAESSSILNLSSSPNATLAGAFLDKSLAAGWRIRAVVPPNRLMPPLSRKGVLPYPALFKIEEKFDFGGLTGSTHFAYGMGQMILFNGNFASRHFGHNRIRAISGGVDKFQVVRTKHILNPLKYRYSYRVLKPGFHKSWTNDDILFTINRDMFGRGLLGIKDEWRIYLGRERYGKERYYCVQSWWGWKTRCWHSKLEYESGRGSLTVNGHPGPKYNPCAVLSQVPNAGALSAVLPGLSFVPDQFYLFVNAGEDAALMMAFSIIVDSAQDQKEN